MKKEFPKIYDPHSIEQDIYRQWETSGCFNPDKINSQETYCNILPPPNANGELHLGHASGYTFMDIFGRFERMNGKKVLLLPGKDHAGIQTQVVFEKKIKQERNVTRYDLGREEFYRETYDFCTASANYMRSQEKKIGISADWSREKFTLDPDVLKTALDTFLKMHADNLIYKGKRIINWCPRCESALSDVEVVHKETPGKIYYIKYPLEENPQKHITVATTRPETLLGDSAVAVNPQDKKYLKFVGKNVILPLQEKIIPIIADSRIDMKFATGAVKITPAHDPLDWEIGKDHGLEEISIINEKSVITEYGGKYKGLSITEARAQIISDLKEKKLLEKIEDIQHSISSCERCKTIIEPLISNQWFVNVDADSFSLKKQAIAAIKSDQIKIFPENFKDILINWFDNMHDWCISRQIWWGPQFPVWYCENCKEEKPIISLQKPTVCPHCKSNKLFQDQNTFDTWFTSGQWAYTPLNFSKGKDTFFYPSDMMIMGRDLLFFWASRMIMLSLYRTGQVPFANLYFTGLVRDKSGQKMSKSKGNGIDPLLMIEKFGTDALRMSLIIDTAPGQDYRLYEEKIETFRNFANKLWNISRYCLTQNDFKLEQKIDLIDIKSGADHWIMRQLSKTITDVNRLFESKQISLAADKLKLFTWNDFADWYIETHKTEQNTKLLGYVLDKLLRLWHPFMPFITEHIWQLSGCQGLLMTSTWPTTTPTDLFRENDAQLFDLIREIIISIRNGRIENKIDPKKKIEIIFEMEHQLKDPKKDIQNFILNQANLIKKLKTGVEKIAFQINIPSEKITRTVAGINIHIPLKGLVDNQKEKEKNQKNQKNLEQYIQNLKNRLTNKEFISKAPAHIVTEQKESLFKAERDLEYLKNQLKQQGE